MACHRLYTGSNGHSHMKELDLSTRPDLTTLHETKGIVFRSSEPGSFSDWYNAPRRQYVITLSGQGEVGLWDVTTHRIRPGDANLAEDLTWDGHTTQVIGDAPRVTATVHLDD